MEIVLVVWSQLVTLGAAVAVWRAMSLRVAHAEAQEAVWAERLSKVRPAPAVVVPAPDLGPILEKVGAMAEKMVAEAVGAVTAVVNGPVQPERVERVVASPEDVLSQFGRDEGSTDEDGNPISVWVPSWETDGWVEPDLGESVDAALNGNLDTP